MLWGGGVAVTGLGLWLALAQNLAFAPANGWLVLRWRRALAHTPSPIVHAQVRLFSDKLTSNLLITGSLGLDGDLLIHRLDLLAALAMTLATAWWTLPSITAALQGMGLLRRPAT